MISELNAFKNNASEYVVQDDKIGYKEQDSIDFGIRFGYKTLFAYLTEHENGKISAGSLNQNKNIVIKLGSYSYAEIPNNKFYAILGVTGTLHSLGSQQKEIIENIYNIKHKTFMPSVYGRKNVRFDKKQDILIEEERNHYDVISRELRNRMAGKNPGTSRAVFIVFENKSDLYKYFNSSSFLQYKQNSLILTEEANKNEKKIIINGSTSSGKITLFTKVFGRGTDFIIHDEIVSKNGGVHVIQTFLSEDESEEIQIIGRTARQGEDGSFNMILAKNSLEKFGIYEKDLNDNSSNLYDFLNEKRKTFFNIQYAENIKYIHDIKQKHDECSEFIKNLLEKNMAKINAFLLKENRAVRACGNSKTLILLDATGSMAHLLHKTKKTLNTMFERVNDILNENHVQQGFQIKIAVYRNYSSSENMILEQSNWEAKPHNLMEFLKKIYVSGGMGNEAIEIGLWQANQEQELSQIILIGDMPPNTKQDVQNKRSSTGFRSSKYSSPTFYLDEVNIIRSKNIKVHSFYVNYAAKSSFEEIARLTTGSCQFLNINSSDGSKNLIDLINVELLRNIGGASGEVLVAAYRRKYNA
jgi:superfamily II DNA/RNA helicase